MDVRHLVEEAEHDDVRRGADRGENAADRAGISRHEHQTCCVLIVVEIDLLAVGGHHLLDGTEEAERDREHHCSGCRVADPAGAERSGETDREEDAARIRADPRAREQPVGKPFVEAVIHHRLREDEPAHEEEDHRICKGSVRVLCRDDTGDNGERRTDQRGNGDGDRFGNPPESDENHDSEQLV